MSPGLRPAARSGRCGSPRRTFARPPAPTFSRPPQQSSSGGAGRPRRYSEVRLGGCRWRRRLPPRMGRRGFLGVGRRPSPFPAVAGCRVGWPRRQFRPAAAGPQRGENVDKCTFSSPHLKCRRSSPFIRKTTNGNPCTQYAAIISMLQPVVAVSGSAALK